MIIMVPPGNYGTTGVYWGKLKTNWNNGYHPYQSGTNMVTSEVRYHGSLYCSYSWNCKAVFVIQGHRSPYKEINMVLDPYRVMSYRISDCKNIVRL